jgi:transcriptional regulator
MTKTRVDLLQGTLAMLILKALEHEPMHGYGVARTIEQATDDVLRVEEGSLYPALHRMEKRGWIASVWGRSENKRRAKFYQLTDLGREQLSEEATEWERYARAVAQMMRTG